MRKFAEKKRKRTRVLKKARLRSIKQNTCGRVTLCQLEGNVDPIRLRTTDEFAAACPRLFALRGNSRAPRPRIMYAGGTDCSHGRDGKEFSFFKAVKPSLLPWLNAGIQTA